MSMWFTRSALGFRGWLAAVRSTGQLRTGLVAGDFTATIVAPGDGAKTTMTVSESTQKAGVYKFDVPSAFLISNGSGEYVVVVEINSTSAPVVRDVQTSILRISSHDFDTIGNMTTRILGLSHEHFRVLNGAHDTDGNLTSATVKIYPTKTDADADTNAIAVYAVTATFSGPGKMTAFKQVRTDA